MPQISTSSTRKTIYLVRHGETDYNQRKIVQGSGIDSDLNETGISQAMAFHKAFGAEGFDAVFVSELKRTHQSVAPFVQAGLKQIMIPEFNEINWGILEGKEPTPERYNHFLGISARWKKGEYEAAVDGGESAASMYARQKIGLSKILNTDYQKILICMHGRAIRSFLCLLTGEELKNMDKFPHENLGLYILEQETRDKFNVIRFNHTDHLKER
jgi:broad specificity phosphatase PhoE